MKRQLRRLLRLGSTAIRAQLEQARGRLVIFDRYTYDADVHWSAHGGPGAAVRRWLVRHAAPAPDVAFLLDVPGDVMFRRKGEHDPALLEARRQRYLALAGRADEIVVVDGTLDPDSLRRRVTALLWKTYAERSSGRGSSRRGGGER